MRHSVTSTSLSLFHSLSLFNTPKNKTRCFIDNLLRRRPSTQLYIYIPDSVRLYGIILILFWFSPPISAPTSPHLSQGSSPVFATPSLTSLVDIRFFHSSRSFWGFPFFNFSSQIFSFVLDSHPLLHVARGQKGAVGFRRPYIGRDPLLALLRFVMIYYLFVFFTVLAGWLSSGPPSLTIYISCFTRSRNGIFWLIILNEKTERKVDDEIPLQGAGGQYDEDCSAIRQHTRGA